MANSIEEKEEWTGNFNPMEDPDERTHLLSVLDSFRYVVIRIPSAITIPGHQHAVTIKNTLLMKLNNKAPTVGSPTTTLLTSAVGLSTLFPPLIGHFSANPHSQFWIRYLISMT